MRVLGIIFLGELHLVILCTFAYTITSTIRHRPELLLEQVEEKVNQLLTEISPTTPLLAFFVENYQEYPNIGNQEQRRKKAIWVSIFYYFSLCYGMLMMIRRVICWLKRKIVFVNATGNIVAMKSPNTCPSLFPALYSIIQ
jgi:hypothetical protein